MSNETYDVTKPWAKKATSLTSEELTQAIDNAVIYKGYYTVINGRQYAAGTAEGLVEALKKYNADRYEDNDRRK